jgi:DNA-binding GntR family transcriptional regulator
MVEPIRISSLASEAFDRVVEVITSGAYEPGQKISESELARQLGISRGPVREALQRLEGRLIERIPRIGVRLIKLEAENLRQLFLIREALEGMAARLAATHATPEWIAATDKILERDARAIKGEGSKSYRQRNSDEDYHFAIARASGCENIERLMLNEVYFQLRLHRLRSSTRPGRAKDALEEHFEIFRAIRDGDADTAEARMRAHVRAARESTLSLL